MTRSGEARLLWNWLQKSHDNYVLFQEEPQDAVRAAERLYKYLSKSAKSLEIFVI